MLSRKKERVVLIVQCRLSSTRLPRKALLPLGGFSIIEWVLSSMKKVPCDAYYLAVDTESAPELEFAAKKYGWDFYAGSRDDVLDRFCKTIELSKADVVVRATADNPFLFYDAASELLEEYKKRKSSSPVDYITWTGLPHGSGIEIFCAQSLLEAAKLSNLTAEDHEHVGPALYKHQDHFNCLFLKSPSAYYYPELRTTIDTASDYRRALSFVRAVSLNKAKTTDTLFKKNILEPYTSKEIVRGMQIPSVKYPMIFVPSTKKGAGTGHLRRCLDLACKTGADIYIPENCGLEQTQALLDEAYSEGLQEWQVVNSLEKISDYNLAVTDLFKTEESEAKKIATQCPVASIDDGSLETDWADYLLDIIPSLGYTRKPNLAEPGFIILPKKRRSEEEQNAKIHTALVVLGGEDPASLAFPSAIALAECGLYVTAIAGDEEKAKSLQDQVPENLSKYIRVIAPVMNLREKLFEFDLVVTHYGFTAFEASAAGCAVILLGTTPLHESLAEKYGFKCVHSSLIN
ncbi:MAG: acylneuraminate cytidylyltransferase, partial [Treponema sp.]|nr:acylneuraminate cytidylyltransferase [Treponema sp.]